MRQISVTDLRQNLAAELDGVGEDREPLMVTRSNAEATVIMSLEEYNAMQETMHLMSSSANARRLNEAIKSLRDGKGRKRKLVEP